MTSPLFVLQGGGPTAVINATLAGIAEQATGRYDRLLGLQHSFEGDTNSPIMDLSELLGNPDAQKRLAQTPGALLGSSRKKVTDQDISNVLNLMHMSGSDSLIGIGGNGTMAALNVLANYAADKGHKLKIVGAPKTVDNDLPHVHIAPGYGSAARFIAMATRDYDRDFLAMDTFDDVTILETMGRDSGWLAAASVFLKDGEAAPHMVLLPERPVDETELLQRVEEIKNEVGRVFIVTNELLNAKGGGLIGESYQNGPTDGLGRKMYSLSLGTGNYLTQLIWKELGLQTRCLRPGNLGRAMSFCVSEPDRHLALRVGRAAVDMIRDMGTVEDMITIDPSLNFGRRALNECVGQTHMPERLLSSDPLGISEDFLAYGRVAIGEITPLF
ncbi:6-phosphofructokinase [Loktanella sp. Alg231-35]|uniref:6-phosphofructokinase n=1 Tax=Loktanella sp. Alg231-35 TaxID=1922220 RepID=UPI000D551BDC|nr:6-phosphofructokinase [Loktanella sp. Alg231-35]